jgi:hypothetical protein
VELTESQERVIKAIMAETDCSKGFECYESKFEDLCAVHRRFGTDLIECQAENGQNCPMSFIFGHETRFCRCKVRKHTAIDLNR